MEKAEIGREKKEQAPLKNSKSTVTAQNIELITTTTIVGAGKDDDPYRVIRQLWVPNGELVVTIDTLKTTDVISDYLASQN